MELNKIMQDLNQIFRELFMDDTLTVNTNTTAADVDGWDSMMHVNLIVNIEEWFGVRFTSYEVGSFKNVGDVVTTLIAKLSNR